MSIHQMLFTNSTNNSEEFQAYFKYGYANAGYPDCSDNLSGFAKNTSARYIAGSTFSPSTFRGQTVEELTVQVGFTPETEGFGGCAFTTSLVRLTMPSDPGQYFFNRLRVLNNFSSVLELDVLTSAATYSAGTWTWEANVPNLDWLEYVAGYTVTLDY